MTEVPVTWIFLRELAALVEGGRGDVACEGKVMQVLNDTNVQTLQPRDIRSWTWHSHLPLASKSGSLFCTATKEKGSANNFCLFFVFVFVFVFLFVLLGCKNSHTG